MTVYDLEFRDGTTEKETDIAEDGTMLEYTIVIDVGGRAGGGAEANPGGR